MTQQPHPREQHRCEPGGRRSHQRDPTDNRRTILKRWRRSHKQRERSGASRPPPSNSKTLYSTPARCSPTRSPPVPQPICATHGSLRNPTIYTLLRRARRVPAFTSVPAPRALHPLSLIRALRALSPLFSFRRCLCPTSRTSPCLTPRPPTFPDLLLLMSVVSNPVFPFLVRHRAHLLVCLSVQPLATLLVSVPFASLRYLTLLRRVPAGGISWLGSRRQFRF